MPRINRLLETKQQLPKWPIGYPDQPTAKGQPEPAVGNKLLIRINKQFQLNAANWGQHQSWGEGEKKFGERWGLFKPD